MAVPICRTVHVICSISHGFDVRGSLDLGSWGRRPHHHTNPDHTAMTQQLFDEKPVFRGRTGPAEPKIGSEEFSLRVRNLSRRTWIGWIPI